MSTKPYDPNFGDDKECKCGHVYYRHFDTYENMKPVGCKYCGCYTFEEKKVYEEYKCPHCGSKLTDSTIAHRDTESGICCSNKNCDYYFHF